MARLTPNDRDELRASLRSAIPSRHAHRDCRSLGGSRHARMSPAPVHRGDAIIVISSGDGSGAGRASGIPLGGRTPPAALSQLAPRISLAMPSGSVIALTAAWSTCATMMAPTSLETVV